MKTGRMVGVVIVAGIAIGALVSRFLPDFNFGGGKGPGEGSVIPVVSKTEPADTGTESPKVSTVTPPPVTETEPPEETPPAAVIFVMIDGREYLLRRGPEGKAPYQPATLEEVVKAAAAATGDEDGIRVRVEQKSSSRELAEQELQKGLRDAGIPGDAIRWKDKPVDAD